LTWFFSKSR